jgi:hypothetical protein
VRARAIERALLVALATSACSAGLCAWSAPAAAEEARPWAGGLGVGGTVALTGAARTGLFAVGALYPGAWAGRFGLRVEARSTGEDEPFDEGLLMAGLTYETAAARPRLSLALHGDAGAVMPDTRPAVGGGVELQLWLFGPVALALDSSAHLLLDGIDSEVVLAGGLGLRLAR